MQNLVNKDIDKWYRPWDIDKHDYVETKDERFFSILIKGVLSWLNRNIIMYGKPIRHFIFNTGSSYLYLENTGYDYTWCELNGEDMLYMERPRCIATIGQLSIPTEELTSVGVRGEYERTSSKDVSLGQTIACNALMQRMPIELSIDLKYIFSTFNEEIIFAQELIEKILFQQYFNIVYLGQCIQCSIEFSKDTKFDFSQIDLSSKETSQKTIDISIIVCSNLPVIDTTTEALCSNVIAYPTGVIDDINTKEVYAKYRV